MPRNAKVAVIPSPYIKRYGEEPLTRFVDWEDAMKVEVVEGVPRDHVRRVVPQFTKACHTPNPERIAADDRTIKEVLGGSALWQSMEILHVTLLLSGASRVLTHQLVRARIGVTFSQQCTGEQDMRHCDYLVPRPWSKNPKSWKLYREQMLLSKQLYVQMVDEDQTSIQEARHVLQPNISTFIYIHACIGTLAALYQKRTCSMSQAWEMKLFADKMKAAVLEVNPEFGPAFTSPCEQGRCWYSKAKTTGFSVTHLFAPDLWHDDFEWNPKTFQHGEKTHAQVSSGQRVKTEHFAGMKAVSARGFKDAMRRTKSL